MGLAGGALQQGYGSAIGSLQDYYGRGAGEMQKGAESMAAAFETGAKDVDIAQVMIEVQKAGLAFRAMTEVRNKLVQAYQDVMNMPL